MDALMVGKGVVGERKGFRWYVAKETADCPILQELTDSRCLGDHKRVAVDRITYGNCARAEDCFAG